MTWHPEKLLHRAQKNRLRGLTAAHDAMAEFYDAATKRLLGLNAEADEAHGKGVARAEEAKMYMRAADADEVLARHGPS